MQPGELHAHVIRTLIETGRAPTIPELARRWQANEEDIRMRLRELQDQHGVVLHTHSDDVWVIHPFSTAPTAFSVHAESRAWWANCAWCALGAAALIGEDCRITSSLGGLGERVDLEIVDGRLRPTELWIHFPVPMERAWDNVLYTCSTMLLFASTRDIEAWSEQHGIPHGDARKVRDFWPFAREWYGRHLADDWTKISVEDARKLFERHGLNGPIWTLAQSGERF